MSKLLTEKFQEIYPEQRELDLEEYFSSIDLLGKRSDEPYIIAAMVSSLDGRANWKRSADELRSPKDDALFYGLRAEADAVLIGAHTLEAERYGPILKDREIMKRRLSRGQTEQPLAVIISKNLNIPWDIPLFQSGEGECLIFTAVSGTAPETKTPVEIIKHPEDIDFPAMVESLRLREQRLVLCEGGPTLHASLEREDLIREIFLSLEPELLGKKNLSWVEGDFLQPRQLRLDSVLQSGSELFLHYECLPAVREAIPEEVGTEVSV